MVIWKINHFSECTVHCNWSSWYTSSHHVFFIGRPDDLFTSVWSQDTQLLKVDPLGEMILGATVLGRGSVSVCDMRRNINK